MGVSPEGPTSPLEGPTDGPSGHERAAESSSVFRSTDEQPEAPVVPPPVEAPSEPPPPDDPVSASSDDDAPAGTPGPDFGLWRVRASTTRTVSPSDIDAAQAAGSAAAPRVEEPTLELVELAVEAAAEGPPAGTQFDTTTAGQVPAAPPDPSATQHTSATGPTPEPDPAELGALRTELGELREQVGALTGAVELVRTSVEELSRLRRHDTELADRLHSDVTRLRAGEVAQAITPVVLSMLKVHDMMVSLGAEDSNSIAGLLRNQLLQSLELTAGVRPYLPAAGEAFDPRLHTGVRRLSTTDASAAGTIARTVRAGFTRADGSIVRTAEVEVHRFTV